MKSLMKLDTILYYFGGLCIWQLDLVVVRATVVLNLIEFQLYMTGYEDLGRFDCCVCVVCDRANAKIAKKPIGHTE